jgi:16S rRNA G527 N7-methylase RsmG
MIELPNGQVMESEPTTTGLTKAQFSDYVEQVLAWATNHGLTQTDEMSVLRATSDTTTQDSSLSLMAP